ncbi:MAG: DUF4292 domain-containing protein [Bacteroidota bacterium]|nr:DUF4292 domain-containing protein [Bacteroidota bacterium]
MTNKIFILSALSLLFTSCGIFRHSGNTHGGIKKDSVQEVKFVETPTMILSDSIKALSPDYQNLSYHFKGRFKSGSKSGPVKGVVSVIKDSALWISLRPGLGIELARLHLTADSLFLLNRLQSEYYAYDYNDFAELSNAQIDYAFFESLLTAQFLQFNRSDKYPAKYYNHQVFNDSIKFSRQWKTSSVHELITNSQGSILSQKLYESNKNAGFTANYNYNENASEPANLNLTIEGKLSVTLNMKLSGFSSDKKSIPSIKIPTYYKKVDFLKGNK